MAASPATLGYLLLWGLIATVAMTTILQASLGLHLSRMSLPFLVGAFFTGDRQWALIVGYIVYTVGGWAFAFFYFLIFASVRIYTWWFGGLCGFLHGAMLLVFALPVLPVVHPRMASEYHGVTNVRQLEPPGFMGLNYGSGTPIATLLAQVVYGLALGGFLQLQQAHGGH
jgi:hypothetical protein